MKLSVTIVLLCIASCAYAQSADKDSRSTKIDENEKKRIENQYKTLSNFYINDDGLVVYQTQGSSLIKESDTVSADTTHNIVSSTVDVETENYISETKTSTKEGEESKGDSLDRPLSSRIISTGSEQSNTGYIASYDKSPVRPTIIKKEAAKPIETLSVDNSDERREDVASKNVPVINSDVADQDLSLDAKRDLDRTKDKKTTKKTSVFEKKKYTPQYKTLEEAALAVEAILEDLKKEQSVTTGAGSMSSRLSGGAGRVSLRKKPVTNPSYSSMNSENNATSRKSVEVAENSVSEFGYEPSYFINGKEVDKVEVNRLRKQQIIAKEVRTRNTVSGNPNGEVWYEVKYDN